VRPVARGHVATRTGESRSATTSSAGPTLVASNEGPHRPRHPAQTDFAIAPVSVAGVVTVKDALDVEFTIVAQSIDPVLEPTRDTSVSAMETADNSLREKTRT
jgi:hypothetical protein